MRARIFGDPSRSGLRFFDTDRIDLFLHTYVIKHTLDVHLDAQRCH